MKVAILTISDRAASGEREDASGPALGEMMAALGGVLVGYRVVPDDRQQIARSLKELAGQADLVLTTGGTGLGERDVTPEATLEVIERQAPGLAEAMRNAGAAKNPHAMLSRAVAGVRGKCLILNLPGSPAGARQSLAAVMAALPHAVELLQGPVSEHSHRYRR